ncbi:putative COG4 transport protein [Trypanosoma cruzi]|nr:putative COG4 transport protein [Trypanosoma cruzi]
MQHLDNMEDRVDALLRQIANGAERRDKIVEAVSQAVADTGSLSACVEDVRTVSRRMLISFVDTSSGLARTVGVSASLAERSSRQVKQLDMLLRRVREAQVVANSLQEMRHTVASVNETMHSGDLERIVELIRKYEEANLNLGGRAPPSLLQDDDDDDNNGGMKEHVKGKEADYANGEEVAPKQQQQQQQQLMMGGEDGNRDATYPSHSAANKSRENKNKDRDNDASHPRNHHFEAASIIASARESAREKLLEKFRVASRSNDKLTIMQATRLLTQLGFSEEGCSLYCTWLCEHTIAALKKMVDRELRKMDDPTEAGMSHLGLVSTVLDAVVAAFENEEEFIRETFGDAGLLKLLTELHCKSTSQCVPVLKDFLKKRQEVLSSVTSAGGINTNSSSSGNAKGQFPAGSVEAAAGSPVFPTTSSAVAATVDPRRTDQILEEMSHLVSCCHLYWTFAQSKQQEYMHGVEATGKQHEQQEVMVSVDSLWSSRDNPLMNTVQEILGVFVPLQTLYFEAAFEQALRLQMDALHAAAREASMSGTEGGGDRSARKRTGVIVHSSSHHHHHHQSSKKNETYSSPSAKKTANFMTGLAALYTSTAAASGGEDEEMPDAAMDQVSITLPDDVFFFLRIALHRAVNTKSTQIISAVFIACIELVQSKLLPVLQLQTTLPPAAQLQQLQQQRQDFTVPSRVLRWTVAAHCTATYARKLAEELRQLARENFSGKDLLRFTEQAEDMDALSRELTTSVEQWVARFAEVCYQVHLTSHLERFSTLSYNLTEEMFYHYELSDPWVQVCVAAADVVLRPLDAHLDTHCFDLFLLALVRRVVKTLWQAILQKSFSGYGALQVDRDVRTLRTFFLGRAHELQLREPFLLLTSATSLLLLDSPKDAEQDVYEGLTADDKRRLLGCRLEFKRAEIERLRL